MPQGHNGFPNILQLVRTTSLWVTGKPGATAGAGLAGGTTSGAPTTGQFAAGDAVVAQNGHLWICTASGTPGTWVDAGASGSYTDPLTTRGDLLVRGAASTGRLALGTSGYIVTSDGTDAVWAAAGAGFADPMTTRGDLIVRGGGGTTRLAVGSAGQYLRSDGTDAAWATVPAARVYNSAALSLSNNTETLLTFDSERFDTDSCHSASSHTERLTCNTAGIYTVWCNLAWAANATGVRYAYFRLNGATVIGHFNIPANSGGGQLTVMTMTTLQQLVATDYIDIMAYQNSGGTLNITAAAQYTPEFAWARVG